MPSGKEIISRPDSTTWDIPRLVSAAISGNLRIPHFQRAFVWDRSDVIKLFDSIWRGFPIGNFLLWNNSAEAGVNHLGPIAIEVDARPEVLWVVDGQQRLTSIVGTLVREFRQLDDRFQIYFDLRRRQFVGHRRQIPPTWLPLHETLETRTLLTWSREHSADLEDEDLAVVDALGGAIRDFQIPAYVVGKNDDYLLREVFDRVNSAGKPIGRAETFHALFASEAEPGSPATVVESLKRLNYGTIDENRVVQSVLALRGGDVQRDIRDEFDDGADPAEWYEKVEVALERAIDFLRGEGVPHLQLVPSTLPLPVLAVFFHLHPTPDSWTRRLLSRWLWRGWALGFGHRGQTPALRQSIRAVKPQKGPDQQVPTEYDATSALINLVPDEEPSYPRLQPFKTNSAAGRIAMLALTTLKPLSPTGEPIDIAGELDEHGPNAITDFVPEGRANLASRGFWPIRSQRPRGTESSEILSSHGIDEVAADALRRGDSNAFLAARGELVLPLVHKYTAARVEAKALLRPPLAELVVDD